ncbi:metalloregulator ArsR/SmtB family transcription factor [Puia sp.]|jgi:DNA-binding transcriptional ArsR family regulator|uniref:ArsR/SmtB family transcription factor n=1 Tax=Puia sp. TaxID=2045100 RepID=UPI002F3F15A1
MRRDVFHAISDPTRREIINLIAHQPLNLNTIAENFTMSRPAISQHMKILIECGLIAVEKKGRERYCEAKLEKLDEVAQWIEQYRAVWQQKHDRLDKVLNKLVNKKRKDQ